LGQGTLSGLALLGINAHFGRAEGSYCEGPFDLVYGSQKIAGIAQAIRGGFALVSGMLMVQQDPVYTTMVLQEFYQRAGSNLELNPHAVTALNRLPGQSHLTVDAVHDALVQGHGSLLSLRPEPLTEEEWRLARQLYRERQVGANPIEEAHYASHH
jgi:lipoate-protein ligase A